MPIVDLAPQPITAITGRPEGFSVTPGKDEIDHGSDAPDFLTHPTLAGTDTPDLPVSSVLGAAFRQGNIGGSAIARQDWGAGSGADEPGFNPWDAIKGTKYEPHWDSFVDIRSTAAADARKRQLDMEDEDRRTLAGAPWYKSIPAQLLAGAADIPSLLPGGAFVRGAQGGFSVARSAAVTVLAAGAGVSAQELALHGTQQTRTLGESGINIGASVLLGGLLGAGGAKLLSRAEWNQSVAALNRDLAGPTTAPIGAPPLHEIVIAHPDVADAIANPKVNRTQDVPYTAGPDNTGNGLNIDRHFPERFAVNEDGSVAADAREGARQAIGDKNFALASDLTTQELQGSFPEVEKQGNGWRLPLKSSEGAEIGHFEFDVTPDAVVVRNPFIESEFQGKGEGVKAYQGLVDFALKTGREFWSDRSVSAQAARMYGALERRGYTVVRDPTAETSAAGAVSMGKGDAAMKIVAGPVDGSAKPAAPVKTFDPAQPFAVHEFAERHAMNTLIAGGMDEATAYKVAHWEVAEPAEGKWYQENGIDQAKAEAAYQPFIDKIEHEKLAKGDGDVPANLYRKPYPHDSVDAAAAEKTAVPKPTAEEVARGREILAQREAKTRAGEGPSFVAFHGSPHDFDRFDASRIGTGEGFEAYGRGLYFAQNEKVIKKYIPQSGGHAYQVKIRADAARFLDWDRPLSEQSPEIQEAFKRIGYENTEWQSRGERGQVLHGPGGVLGAVETKGGKFDAYFMKPERGGWSPTKSFDSLAEAKKYIEDSTSAGDAFARTGGTAVDVLRSRLGDYQQVSDALREAGIPGIKYLDQGSRAGFEGTSNLVVFDPDIVDITHKNGIPIGSPAGVPASAGAAAHEPVGIESNTIAGRAAGAVAAASRSLNPLLRIMQSPSAAVREIGGKLFENSVYLKKNFEGVASEPAVETLMKEWNGGLVKALQSTKGAWRDYRKGGGQLGKADFREAVGRAMRRGDEDPIPEVAAVAKAWRTQVFDPLKQAAIKAGLLPEDVSVDTAASYFSRMWNRNLLIGQEGRFKGIVSNYYNNVIGKEYEKATAGFNARMAKLEQEKEDINLSAAERTQRLGELETAAEEHEAAGAAYQDLAEKADRLADIAADMRRLKGAGDTMVARQNMAAAKAETAAIKEAGGKDLKDFIAKRSELRKRRSNVDLGAAGLAERSQQVMESLADLEEANQRSLGRLVKKGQTLERELDKIDPDDLAERIGDMRQSFVDVASRADAAADRADKAIAKMKEDAEKRAERADTSEKGAAALDAAAAKIADRLANHAERQRALADRMETISRRLDIAEGFDREGAVTELRAGVDKAIAETSDTSLGRGERAQRMQERLAALDPQRIKDRTAAIDQMKKDLERAYYDRWEIKNLGKGVDPAAKDRPDFSDAARDIADTVYNTLTGRTEAGVRPEFMSVGTRGPMKDRTFNIPDELIEDFLEHDVDNVGKRYVRVMGADVEMANKFGSVDMKDQLADIRANYDRMRAGLPDGPQKTALRKAEESDTNDITSVRDLLRSTRQEAMWDRTWSKIVRNAGYLNYLRTMGEIVLGNLNDAVRPAMVHGLMAYMRTMGQLATNLSAIKMSIEEARLAGNVAERVLASRMATLTEITDPYASRGPVEAFLENMSNSLSKWNGIRLWNDMQKSITAVMTQDRILRGVENFAGTKDKPYLAFMGIDESMAGRMQAQFAAHGENVDGVRVANTEQWTDPVAVRTYRAAMNKDIDSIIVTAGKADLPLFVNTPTGKLFAQFQGYTLASHQRILLRGLQESPTRFIGGVVANTAMGMAIVYLKALSANRTDKLESMSDNPGWWIAEGFDRAGVIAVPVELANRTEKLTGFNPIKGPMKIFDKGRAESEKNQGHDFGSMLGPTFGLGQDIATVLGIPHAAYEGKDVRQAQKNAAVRIMPFQSYYGVRQMMNYVVNPPH